MWERILLERIPLGERRNCHLRERHIQLKEPRWELLWERHTNHQQEHHKRRELELHSCRQQEHHKRQLGLLLHKQEFLHKQEGELLWERHKHHQREREHHKHLVHHKHQLGLLQHNRIHNSHQRERHNRHQQERRNRHQQERHKREQQELQVQGVGQVQVRGQGQLCKIRCQHVFHVFRNEKNIELSWFGLSMIGKQCFKSLIE